MKEYFSLQQKERELNKVYLEEDDVLITGEFIEGEGKVFVICGSALIEGEVYKDFEVQFELMEEPEEETIEEIMNTEWQWYDFLC